jgi:acetylornithine deacetylase/succinyl-diaminopimelate desuccinylase-like protein
MVGAVQQLARLRPALLAAGLLLAHGAAAADFNWAEVEEQATEFLSRYIQIDTSNPPGNETAAARFLAARFRQAGIDAQVFESEPGRGSVLARVQGTGALRPIILLSHLDVVPAKEADGWDLPPFSGAVRDGYVYGRGAIDCKGPGTIEAMALLLLKRHGIQLKRDVIFLGTADEETGGQLGAGWMVAHHFDALRNAEFVVNEGASVHVSEDGSRAYEVAVSEKTPCWLQLATSGPPGHGSAPAPQTAVTRLIRALEHLRLYQPPLRVTPEVQAYYAALAATQTGERRERYKDLSAALADEDFRSRFLQDPHDAALVQDTITPTVLQGSPKVNVIPPAAQADLDGRLLPGDDPQAFVRAVTDLIADPDVKVSVLLNFPPSSSSTDTPFFAAVRTLAERDGAPVVPSVLTGFTDSHYFRDQGIASYGFIPFDLSEDEERREHGLNERVSTRNLREGTRRLIEMLQILDSEARYDGESQAGKK